MEDQKFGHYVETLAATPGKLRSLLQGLSDEQLRFKPSENKFSLKENMLHLRDIEVEGHQRRIRLIMTEDTPTLEDIDGARLARLRRYQSANATKALGQFCQAREANLAYLRNMTAFQWNRKALLDGDDVTLIQLVGKWVMHDLQHLEEMDALLAKITVSAA